MVYKSPKEWGIPEAPSDNECYSCGHSLFPRDSKYVGIEEVETGLGIVSAWHLVRSARKNSYEQSLDVWLAPKHEWYPVKVRYTNTNGDFLDLSLSDITRP